jgi:glycogen synthase
VNIVLVSFEFPPLNAVGGIGSYMYHLCQLLNDAQHSVTVFSANPSAKELEVIQRTYCTNYLLPSKSNEEFRSDVLPVFNSFLEKNKVDVIESPEVGACALYIKETNPHIPLVVKMHTPGVLITRVSNTYIPLKKKLRFVAGSILRGKPNAGYWSTKDANKESDLEYQICMLADTLTSPSLALKKWTNKFWDIPLERINIIPNPFSPNLSLFSLPISARENLVTFIGKLSVLKGMYALTKAIPIILKQNPSYKILLVGRDETENGLSMKAYMQNELKAFLPKIIFCGVLTEKELEVVFSKSKICIVPSLWENYPTVILEAMAAGVAVTASDAGGIGEIIMHDVTGVLFNPKKPSQIANAVNTLINNDTKRIELAETARKNLSENNKLSRGKIINVYDNILIK